jgi:GAF domain-containing protein
MPSPCSLFYPTRLANERSGKLVRDTANLRAPGALPRLVNLGVTAIINQEECIGRLMVLDHRTDLQHQFEMRILGWNAEDVRLVVVVVAQAFFEVFQFRQYEEVVAFPVEQQCLNLLIPL